MHAIKVVLALVAMLAAATLSAPPAHAGYWAATTLDPIPDRIEPGQSYTIGYWVMQHAAHPYDGDYGPLGRTGLKIVDKGGNTHTFSGVPLGQTSHYATTIAIPHPGTWQLIAAQGRFGDYRIGTLTVPGGLEVAPLPPPVAGHDDRMRWGLIQSPDLDAIRAAALEADSAPRTGEQHNDVTSAASAVDADAASDASNSPFTPVLWILLTVSTLGGLLILRRRALTGGVARKRRQSRTWRNVG